VVLRETWYSQVLVAQKVTAGVYKGVTTSELDELAAETAASMTATHPDYALVQARRPNSLTVSKSCLVKRIGARSLAAASLSYTRPLLMPELCPFLQLAARIANSNLHKNTLKSFSET
jgi:hypothetical protein